MLVSKDKWLNIPTVKDKTGECLTDTLVGFPGCGALPGSVVVERFAPVALRSRRVVFALAHQIPLSVLDALWSMPIALAPSSYLQVRHCVKVGVAGQLGVVLILVSKSVKPAEDHFDVGGRHPVLEHRGVVEVVRRRSAVQGAEGYEPTCQRVHVCVGVRADRLLLVLLCDSCLVLPVVHLLALSRVKLKWHPRFAIVHGLVDRHGLGSGWAELQAHICDLKLFTQGQGEGDVLRILHVVFRLPAGEVVRVVEVCQIGRWMGFFGISGVACVTVPSPLFSFLGHHTVAGGRCAAGAGHAHVLPKSGVDEVGDASPRIPVLIIARVRRGRLCSKHAEPVSSKDTFAKRRNCHQGDPNLQNPLHCNPCVAGTLALKCNEDKTIS